VAGIIVALALKARRVWVAWLIVAVGVGAAIGLTTVLSAQLERAAGQSGDPLAARTVTGLTNPFSRQQSTLTLHWESITASIETGFKEPLGTGTGATNLAADQLAEGRLETDNDLADAFRNLGFVGGLLFLAIVVVALTKVGRRAIRQRDPIAVAVGALLVANLGFWGEGGHYATSALMWFLMGAATRPQDELTAGYVTSRKRRRGLSERSSSTVIPPPSRPVTAAAAKRPVSGS
jgi:cell division protein FtsW (lipid II flippase)